MQFSDLKKEFERIQSLLKSGTSKVDAKEYKDACEDLEECLALLEKGHPEDHPDRVSCLNALGETYFALRRYEQAFKVYKTLLKLNEDHPDNSSDELVIRFKLAKSAEHTRSIEEAIRAYEELTELAEASLPEGHPFISNILEGHAAIKARTDAKKSAKLLSQQARSNRNKHSQKGSVSKSVLLDLRQNQEEGARNNATIGGANEQSLLDMENSIFFLDPSSQSHKSRLRDTQASPKRQLAAISAGACVVLAAVGGIVFFRLHPPSHQSEPKAAAKAVSLKRLENFQPRSYFSLDGQKSLELLDPTNAKLTSGADSQTVGLCKSGSIIAALHAGDGMTFEEHNGFITDSSGLRLYRQEAPELKVVKNMQALTEHSVTHNWLTSMTRKPESTTLRNTILSRILACSAPPMTPG